MPHAFQSNRWLPLALILGVVGSFSTNTPAQEEFTTDAVLDRLHAYLDDYAVRLPATIASEYYVQRAGSAQVILESDFGIVRLPRLHQWLGFRDVRRANGKEVGDRAQRLDALFLHPPSDAARQASLIAKESARQNIGPIARTINNPALVLEMLDGRNAFRMRFDKGRLESTGGVHAWVVRFRELSRPTIVSSGGNGDAPASGRAWIDPSTGTLLRAEVGVATPGVGGPYTCTIEVGFEKDAKLDFFVPARMTEEYLNGRQGRLSTGLATYTDYRQFTVDTNEALTPSQ